MEGEYIVARGLVPPYFAVFAIGEQMVVFNLIYRNFNVVVETQDFVVSSVERFCVSNLFVNKKSTKV